MNTTNLVASADDEDPYPIETINYYLNDITQSSIFLFKKNDQIFGGYSENSWLSRGAFGSNRNFLFNLTKDIILFPTKTHSSGKVVYQYREEDTLGWGTTDLIVSHDVSFYSFIFFRVFGYQKLIIAIQLLEKFLLKKKKPFLLELIRLFRICLKFGKLNMAFLINVENVLD